MTIKLTPISGLTTGELVLAALNLMGIEEAGETSTPEDLQQGLKFLNLLLDEWSIERNKIYVRVEDIKVLDVNKAEYTIGVGADINTVVPEEIEQAFIRNIQLATPSNPLGLDWYISTSMNQEEYNLIPLKSITTIPSKLFYLKQYPVGMIKFNYAPNYAYELHLFSWKPFTRFKDINEGIMLPPGYEAALTYNLAVAFAPAFGKEAPQSVVVRAIELANKIGAKNYEIPRIKLQGIPGTRTRNTGSIYNPFTRS